MNSCGNPGCCAVMRTLFQQMKAELQAIFSLPHVTQREFFLARLFFAFVLISFFPWGMRETEQPMPVGLAHFFDLTWMSVDSKFMLLRGVFFSLLMVYVAGLALPLVLPVMAVLQLLPYTLLNSQGHPHHGYQVLSIPLCLMAGAALLQLRSLRIHARLILRVLLAFVLGYAWHLWMLSAPRSGLAQTVMNICGTGSLAGWVMRLLEFAAFALLGRVAAGTVAGPDERSQLGAWQLYLAQWGIAAAYFVSVCSKMYLSGGAWFMRSHYIVLDMVKATRQSYYSALDPALKVDPPLVHFFMEHQNLTRLFFSTGVILEIIIILVTGTRWWALLMGISMIAMHRGIEALMTLTFYTNESMLLVFFVNLPYWLQFCTRQSRLQPSLS
jgi:hypothetical protein